MSKETNRPCFISGLARLHALPTVPIFACHRSLESLESRPGHSSEALSKPPSEQTESMEKSIGEARKVTSGKNQRRFTGLLAQDGPVRVEHIAFFSTPKASGSCLHRCHYI